MFTNIFISLQWWSVLFLVGLIFYPLTSRFFSVFIDRGYALSKILGVLLLSYFMLTLGTLHILPFSMLSLDLILGIFLLGTIWILRKNKTPVKEVYRPYLRWILVEELAFLLIFSFWAYVRSFAPEINGLEKFMDYGFVNSILKASYFPPKDMWFTPFSINYYYFGHLVTAVLTKLSLLPANITYNLMIATLAGLTFSSSFSIAINLYNQLIQKKNFLRFLVVGILTGAILTFAGNLHTLYTLDKPYENEHPVPLWQLSFSPQTFPNSYWYPNATRFIHNTIHEFPIYSWTVSDLHGHVTDIPFVLLTIAFLYALFLSYQAGKTKIIKHQTTSLFSKYYYRLSEELPIHPLHLLGISLLLAVMYMTNAWDGIIYLLLAVMLMAYLEWQIIKKAKNPLPTKVIFLGLELIIPVIVLGFGFFLFSLPFSLFFKPFVSGIGVLCAPSFLTKLGHIGPLLFEPDHCQKSPLWQLVMLYGFFYFFVIVFLAALAKLRPKKWLPSDIFVLLLIFLSTLLIIIPEFIYAKDIYPAHYRANTMFKLVFQAFIMLSLVSGYVISRVSLLLKAHHSLKNLLSYGGFFLVSLVLLLAVFIYPYFAIMSYYGELKTFKGLDGTAYLKDRYPSDYNAIIWLNTHITGQPVILEAQGDSYTDYARVSANTGLPTVLGWTVHEWLWRGTYDIPAPRIDEVKQMYELSDVNKTKNLLKKYNVKYVFVGILERQKYAVNDEKFAKLGKIIYEKDATKIYEIR